jgi:pSer/pThr/pTyr-binding forkhead associated (FHA) protein
MTLALRFISGKYQGGEFPLEDGREIFVGRSSELGMVLVEEMVSRKHARIIARGGTVEIEDLGSTNGTLSMVSASLRRLPPKGIAS